MYTLEVKNHSRPWTTEMAASVIGIKPNTLESWRVKGFGPAYKKIGRSVRYLEADVMSWLQAQTCNSTSQYPTLGRSKKVAPAGLQNTTSRDSCTDSKHESLCQHTHPTDDIKGGV